MRRYLSTARRYRWLLGAILVLVWGAGLAAAYHDYATTFQSEATVWVLRPAPDLTATNLDDPSAPIVKTVAAQQAELLSQLLETRSFVHDVVERTSLRSTLDATPDATKYLDGIGKRFRVQALGTNMLRVSFVAHDPRTPPEMVTAALAVRTERVAQARIAGTTALSTLYRRGIDVAQNQVQDAQRELDQFDASHRGPLGAEDDHQHGQLRLALDFAQARLSDLKGRADRAAVAGAVLEMSGMEFQVVDEPREESTPSGGARSAAILAAVAVAAGSALAALLILVGTLLADHVSEPADLGRLGPARLFARVPQVVGTKGAAEHDLRATLARIAFADGDPGGGGVGARGWGRHDGGNAWP